MVKGKKGGFIRKVNDSKNLRQAQDGEMYATVTKMYGYGRIEVKLLNNQTYPCVIPKKFRHGHERVPLGSFVLVGFREFETIKDICDLLEVYTPQEVSRLQSIEPCLAVKDDHDIIFTENESISLSASGDTTVIDEIDYDLI